MTDRSIALALCLALFAAIASIDINRYGLDGDESVSRWLSTMAFADMFAQIHTKDGVFALYYSVLHLWALGGHTAPYLRTLSAIFAVASLMIVYRIAATLFDSAVAAWSVGMLSVSFLFLKYATVLRPYSIEFFVCCLAAWFAVRTLLRTSDRSAPWLFAISSIVALFVHPATIAWVGALLLSIVLFDANPKAAGARLYLPAFAIIVFGIAPLAIVTARDRFGAQIAWIGPITLQKVAVSLSYFGGGGSLVAIALLALVIGAALSPNVRQHRTSLYLALFWITCSFALVLVISVKKNIIQPYYYIYGWIALCMIAGTGLEALRRSKLRFACIVALAALAMLNAYQVVTNAWRLEDFRAAATALHGNVRASDAIVVHQAFYTRALYYALEERGDQAYGAKIVYPAHLFTRFREDPPRTLSDDLSHRYRSIWLVLSHPDLDGYPVVARLIRRYTHREVREFAGVSVAHLWKDAASRRDYRRGIRE